MTPLAGGLQRLAERVARSRVVAKVLMSETLTAAEAERIGLVYRVVPDRELEAAADALGEQLGHGATRGYSATRALLKAWSSGGVAGADQLMLDLLTDLYTSNDALNAIEKIARIAEHGMADFPPSFEGACWLSATATSLSAQSPLGAWRLATTW